MRRALRHLAALIAMIAISAVLNFDRQVRWLACAAPGWFIGLAGALMWANFDLAWKIYRWSATHDSASVVLTHLFASLIARFDEARAGDDNEIESYCRSAVR